MRTRRRYNFRIYQGDTLVSKECGKCLTYKSVDEFTIDSSHKDGYTPKCKDCINGYQKVYKKEYYYPNNRGYSQQYYKNNKEHMDQYSREYYRSHK